MRSARRMPRAGPAHPGEGRTGLERLAVASERLDRDARVDEAERGREHVDAAEHAGLARDELGGGGGIGGDERLGGEVAPRRVLVERGADDAVDLAGVGHQAASSSGARDAAGDAACAGSSVRKCAPTLSRRACAAATVSRARSSRLRSSAVRRSRTSGARQASRRADAAARPAASRSSPTLLPHELAQVLTVDDLGRAVARYRWNAGSLGRRAGDGVGHGGVSGRTTCTRRRLGECHEGVGHRAAFDAGVGGEGTGRAVGEDGGLEQGVRRQAVGAVHAGAGGLADGVQPGQARATVEVGDARRPWRSERRE